MVRDFMAMVKFFAYFRDAVGKNEAIIHADNVTELVDELIADYKKSAPLLVEYPEPMKLKKDVMILVNGRNIWSLDGLKTKLKKEDVVSIFPPVCGG